MKVLQALGLVLAVVGAHLDTATSFSGISKRQARLQNALSSPLSPAIVLRSGAANSKPATATATASEDDDPTLKDFSGEASGLFGNVRIPAALFAGASAGAAFAMPISATASEGLKIGLVKRIYALLMMGSLTSEIIAIVVGTVAASALANNCASSKASNVSEFLNINFGLEWAACRFHFLFGVLFFVEGIGLRAWVTIACPIFAKAAFGLVVTTSLLCAAFVEDMYARIDGTTAAAAGGRDSFSLLPFRYLRLLTERARTKPLFGLAFISFICTFGYLGMEGPHIWHYLAAN